MPARLERSQKTPNLVLDVYTTEKFTLADGFDGRRRGRKRRTAP